MARKAYPRSPTPPTKVVSLDSMRHNDPVLTKMRELLAPYTQWPHPDCKDTHGVLRKVPPGLMPSVENAMLRLHGSTGWRRFNDGESVDYDVEFISGVLPRPKNSWDYCGTSILFEGHHQRHIAEMSAIQQFTPGDAVSFLHMGVSKHGLVASVNETRCTVVVKGEGKMYVHGKDMTKDE